jgi:hypothetical protein
MLGLLCPSAVPVVVIIIELPPMVFCLFRIQQRVRIVTYKCHGEGRVVPSMRKFLGISESSFSGREEKLREERAQFDPAKGSTKFPSQQT